MAKAIAQKTIKALGKTWQNSNSCTLGRLFPGTLIDLFKKISNQEDIPTLAIIKGQSLKGVPTSCDFTWDDREKADVISLNYWNKYFKLSTCGREVTFSYNQNTNQVTCSDLSKLADWVISDCQSFGHMSQFSNF